VNRRVTPSWIVQSHIQIHIRRLNRRTKSKKVLSIPYHTPALAPAAAQQKYKSLAARIHTHIYTYKSASLRHNKPKDRAAPSRLVSSRLTSPHLTSLFDSAATSPETNVPAQDSPNSPCQPSRALAPYRDPSLVLCSRTAGGANERAGTAQYDRTRDGDEDALILFFPLGTRTHSLWTQHFPKQLSALHCIALHCVCVTALRCVASS
jgi:hypothetical protein